MNNTTPTDTDPALMGWAFVEALLRSAAHTTLYAARVAKEFQLDDECVELSPAWTIAWPFLASVEERKFSRAARTCDARGHADERSPEM